MTIHSFGWLYGLVSDEDIKLTIGNITIRKMHSSEQARIINASHDFFAKDTVIWENLSDRFCYVYEIDYGDSQVSIGNSPIALLLSVLSYGEMHSPIQWTEISGGGGGSSSSSTIADLFFRAINSRYISTKFDTITESTEKLLSIFHDDIINGKISSLFDSVLVERLYAAKSHAVDLSASHAQDEKIIARAADLCMCFEYLMNEGSTSEVLFRLGMSLAWLLGETPNDRNSIIEVVKHNYTLRSKKIHGAKISDKQRKKFSLENLLKFDILLRRAILAKSIAGLDDVAWIEKIKLARIGTTDEGFDRVTWVNA